MHLFPKCLQLVVGRSEGDALFPNQRRADALRPNNAIHILQLTQNLTRIRSVVFMYDDLHFLVAFGLGDWSAGEDRDFGDRGSDDHVLEDCGAHEARCACEDEMHLVLKE